MDLITYKKIKNIKFPIYVLPSDDIYLTDGVLFLGSKVIDEKNMPGKTLGIRRLQCHRSDLFPLTKCLFDIPDLIKSKTKIFIDRKGKPFTYMKTITSQLKCYKIKNIETKEIASLLWLHTIPYPITIERPPIGNPEFVRMLHLKGVPWLVYDYVRSLEKDTYRRV